MRLAGRKYLADAVVLASVGFCAVSACVDVVLIQLGKATVRSLANGIHMPYPTGAILNALTVAKGSMLQLSAASTVAAALLVVWMRRFVAPLDSWRVAALPLVALAVPLAGPAAILMKMEPESFAQAEEQLAWVRDGISLMPVGSALVPFTVAVAFVGIVLTLRSVQAGRDQRNCRRPPGIFVNNT